MVAQDMRVTAFAFLGMMALGFSAVPGADLVPVGLQKQLLVDDYVIAEMHNVTRELGVVKKHAVVLEPTLPTDFIPPQGERDSDHYDRALRRGNEASEANAEDLRRLQVVTLQSETRGE